MHWSVQPALRMKSALGRNPRQIILLIVCVTEQPAYFVNESGGRAWTLKSNLRRLNS